MGTGRPHITLAQQRTDAYHAAILHACCYNVVFDPLCEGSRVDYMLDLIALTGDEAWFRQRLLDTFAESPDDDDLDTPDLFRFALHYARQGDARARMLMYEQFALEADRYATGAFELIDLDGLAGFRAVAARLGEVADEADEEYWDSDYIVQHLKEVVPDVTDDDIAALAAADPRIARYLAIIETNMARREQQRTYRYEDLRDLSYPELRLRIEDDTVRVTRRQLRTWGREASDPDALAAAHDLLLQQDPQRLITYLEIFDERAFPLGAASLLPLVRHENERVVRCTLNSLSSIKDPALHTLAHELVRERYYLITSLGLFGQNYQPGEEGLFFEVWNEAQSDEELHNVGFGLLDVFATADVQRAEELLLTIYERLPCSLCRTKVVRHLAERQVLPRWMAEECQYDANSKTVEIAREYLDADA